MMYFASVFVMAFIVGLTIMLNEAIKDTEARKNFTAWVILGGIFLISLTFLIKI